MMTAYEIEKVKKESTKMIYICLRKLKHDSYQISDSQEMFDKVYSTRQFATELFRLGLISSDMCHYIIRKTRAIKNRWKYDNWHMNYLNYSKQIV